MSACDVVDGCAGRQEKSGDRWKSVTVKDAANHTGPEVMRGLPARADAKRSTGVRKPGIERRRKMAEFGCADVFSSHTRSSKSRCGMEDCADDGVDRVVALSPSMVN